MDRALQELLWERGKLNPARLPNLAAWYDVSDFSRLTIDGSNRVQLIADKSAWSTENALVLPGVSGNFASALSADVSPVTGDIDLIARCQFATWATGTYTIVSKRLQTGNQISYDLTIVNGALAGRWSSNGAVNAGESATSSATVEFAAFAIGWVRVTRASASGDVKFYTSTDGTTWTQLGTTQATNAGAIYSSTANVEVGSHTLGANNVLGSVYRAIIKSGIGGTTVFDIDFTTYAKLAASPVTAITGQSVTINATAIALPARIHGARDLYMGTQARQPFYAAWDGTNYIYFSGVSGNTISCPVANDTYDVAILYKDGTSDTSTIVVGAGTATFGGTDAKFSVKGVAKITLTKTAVVIAVCNPSDYPSTGGSTFVSSATGETWTINGGATIVDRTQIIHDGTDDYFKSAAYSLSQPENVYVGGLKQITWTSNDKLYDGNSATERMALLQYTGGASPQIGMFAGTTAGPYTTFVTKTAAVIYSLFNGASGLFRVNRTTASAASTTNTQSGNGFTLGAALDGSAAANMAWSEVLIYDTPAHTTAQQDRLNLYLGRKWRIPNV